MKNNRIVGIALSLWLALDLANSPTFGQPSTVEPAGQAESDEQILSYEIVQDLQVRTAAGKAESEGDEQSSGLASISFRAFDQQFTVVLEPNERLVASLPAAQRRQLLSAGQVYKGSLAGLEGSWVRLTQIGDQWSGLIWDGIELYAIEPASAKAASAPPPPQAGETALIIYRASEVTSPGTCALDPTAQALHSYGDLVKELQTLVPALPAATAQIDVSIVADLPFSQNTPDPQGRALSLLNAVDGIYSEQVGVALNVTGVELLQNSGGLSSTDPQTLLNQLSNLSDSPNINNPGLLHLLTGRNLNGSTIGIAFLGVLCDPRFGVGLSEIRTGSLASQVVLIAHEIGHNFGAPHDNQGGSPCASTSSGFIMNPSINGSSDTFSGCSVAQMQPHIANASCLADLPDQPPPPVGSCLFSAEFANSAVGFVFIDDPQTPQFTSGEQGADSLQTLVGGVNNSDVLDMRGSWERLCTLAEPTQVTLNVQASLSQAADYEADEVSQIGVTVNGTSTVLASFTGDGNGGAEQTTGLQTFRLTTTLPAGTTALSLDCMNTKKTFNNELTRCEFGRVVVSDNINPAPGLAADFNTDTGGFGFEPDVNSAEAPFTLGARTETGGVAGTGALQITLGGINNATITNMEANWTASFTSDGPVQFSVDANLIQAADYESDEFGEIGIVIDGERLVFARLTGNGNGGSIQTTGFQTLSQQLDIGPGSHTISLNCFNNKKTFNNELTTCLFDNVRIE